MYSMKWGPQQLSDLQAPSPLIQKIRVGEIVQGGHRSDLTTVGENYTSVDRGPILRTAHGVWKFVCLFTMVEKLLTDISKSSEDLLMRMVLDKRRDNLQWRQPPSAPMASATTFAYVDRSEDAVREDSPVNLMTAYLSD